MPVRTDVYCTLDQVNTILRLIHVRQTEDKKDVVEKSIHALALEHGLPEIAGYYGMSLATANIGEFLAPGDARDK